MFKLNNPKDVGAVYDKRQIKENSVTICLFTYDENLKDILTMLTRKTVYIHCIDL
jgi:hypothetical protein